MKCLNSLLQRGGGEKWRRCGRRRREVEKRDGKVEEEGLKGKLWDGWLAPVSKVTLYNCITAERDGSDVEEQPGGGLWKGDMDRSSQETELKKTEAPLCDSDLHIQD